MNKIAKKDTNEEDFQKLKSLIITLQSSVGKNKITAKDVNLAISDLKELGYTYKAEKFPVLDKTNGYEYKSHNSPENFAEAMLWKLGKWKNYKKYAEMYNSELQSKSNSELKAKPISIPDNTGVVFYGFVKHLVNNKNPIYDQHAMRALWAICNLTDVEETSCKKALFKVDESWKPAMSGAHTTKCYELFIKYVKTLTVVDGDVTLRKLDDLLMPMGQAIKDFAKGSGVTKDFGAFQILRGRQ